MRGAFLYFTLGSLFTLSLSTNSAIIHFISISSIYLFCFILFRLKQIGTRHIEMNVFQLSLITIKEIACGMAIIFLEHYIQKWIPFFRWKFIKRIGAIILISGVLLSFSSMFTYDLIGVSKKGPYAYIRLPLVLGSSLYLLGSLIYLGNYFSIPIYFYFFINTLLKRINNMEVIKSKASIEYKKYLEEVPSGIPFYK